MSSNKFKKIYRILSIGLIIVFMFTFVTASAYSDDSVINEVRQLLKTYYVDDLPDSVINQPTVDGILKEINKSDPHTMYFTASKFDDFTNSINNTFSGIGVQIEIVPQGVQVITVFDNSPAKEVGMKPGDIIMMADNHILSGLVDTVATGYIKGIEGTSVKLKVLRGSALLTLDVTRRQISAPTVDGSILDKHIGYIRLVSFGQDTATKFGKIIDDYESKNVDSYVVDLRYNGGGYLDTALNIAGYFVGNNVALITKSRNEGELKHYGTLHKNIINKPVIFLINEYSASASEVLSGAVKDYGKAYFVGLNSYGKGSVQMPATLSNNDTLKLTIERFYSPKGNTINKVGIKPDYNVANDIDSMRVAELMLDTPKALKNNSGYVKIKLKDRTFIVSINRAEQPLYWNSYKQFINAAATTTGGGVSVMLGTDKGWSTVTKDNLKNTAKMYYPSYKSLAKLKSVKLQTNFTLNFKSKLMKNSINDKNIELIDTLSGDRLPITFTSTSTPTKTNDVIVTPKSELKKGTTYYLVVNPKILKSDNKALGYGMINEIETIK